jgi:hypothetical protein
VLAIEEATAIREISSYDAREMPSPMDCASRFPLSERIRAAYFLRVCGMAGLQTGEILGWVCWTPRLSAESSRVRLVSTFEPRGMSGGRMGLGFGRATCSDLGLAT